MLDCIWQSVVGLHSISKWSKYRKHAIVTMFAVTECMKLYMVKVLDAEADAERLCLICGRWSMTGNNIKHEYWLYNFNFLNIVWYCSNLFYKRQYREYPIHIIQQIIAFHFFILCSPSQRRVNTSWWPPIHPPIHNWSRKNALIKFFAIYIIIFYKI